MEYKLETLFQKSALIPVVVQHYQTGKVLMVGFTDLRGVEKTLETKTACFFSRSRRTFWQKGETSGHYLYLKEMRTDCDDDTLLYLCDPAGPTCHTGEESCFFKTIWKEEEHE